MRVGATESFPSAQRLRSKLKLRAARDSKRDFLVLFFRWGEKIILCGCSNFAEKRFDAEELMKGDGREDGRRRKTTDRRELSTKKNQNSHFNVCFASLWRSLVDLVESKSEKITPIPIIGHI